MNKNIDDIIGFWFGELDNQLAKPQQFALWYQATPAQDTEIKQKFEHLYQQAFHGYLDKWTQSAKGCLALIILLDQMPRNMYRGTDMAFASDHLALKHCLYGLEQNLEKQLALVERSFFYHPLEHSEDIAMQKKCVVQFQRLQQVYQNEEQQKFIRHSLFFAKQHLHIISTFGRFPYRNEILGRESSAAEQEFLKTGINFGQASSN